MFLWAEFLLNISLSDSVLETKKTSGGIDSFSLVRPIRSFEPFYQGSWLAHCNVFYLSIEHADDTFIRF